MDENIGWNEAVKDGCWPVILPGKSPETVEAAIELRRRIRPLLANRPGLFALFGFRQPRKKRAPRTTDDLRAPTKDDDREALEALEGGLTVFEAHEYFRDRGIAMTHNRLSQLGGARP